MKLSFEEVLQRRIQSYRDKSLRFYIISRMEEPFANGAQNIFIGVVQVGGDGKLRFSKKATPIFIVKESASKEDVINLKAVLARLNTFLGLSSTEAIGLIINVFLPLFPDFEDEASRQKLIGDDIKITELKALLLVWNKFEPQLNTILKSILPPEKKGKAIPAYYMFPPEFRSYDDLEEFSAITQNIKMGMNSLGEDLSIDLSKDGRGDRWKNIVQNIEIVIGKVIDSPPGDYAQKIFDEKKGRYIGERIADAIDDHRHLYSDLIGESSEEVRGTSHKNISRAASSYIKRMPNKN